MTVAPTTAPAAALLPYPGHWESDVVLADGSVVHLRPIVPDDADPLVAFHQRLSPETVYFRFFAAHPRLLPAEVEHFTHVDYHGRVALIAELAGELVAVGCYERLPGTNTAEVALVVDDRYQGRGIGTLLLEDLAAIGREQGLTRFVGETLWANTKMLQVFRDAGFSAVKRLEDDVVHVEFSIEPTEAARAVVEAREHRAESRSVDRLLGARSVAVVGASRQPTSIGQQVLRNLDAAGFAGPIHVVNPNADEVGGFATSASILDVPGDVDLAVVAVPAPAVTRVVEECGQKGVRGIVVLSAGFREVGAEGATAEEGLRRTARRYGMRLVGPNCIGVLNTATGLDATFTPYIPSAGAVAMQSQSGAVGIALLELASRVGLGVSSFVSAGNQADVSTNDLLQYWEDDPATSVVLLYLESFGNPAKFARIARRVSRRKPIVAVKSGRSEAGARAAGSHTAAMTTSDASVDALFRQAGVIRVNRLDELFDMAVLLAHQPLPRGRRLAIVGNSGGPGVLAADACTAAGLVLAELGEPTQEALRRAAGANAAVTNPVDLVASATPDTFEGAVRSVLADPGVDGVLTICTPTLFADPEPVAAAVQRAGAGAEKPVIACFLAWPGMPTLVRGPEGPAVPAVDSPEAAVGCLGRAVGYHDWLRREPGTVPMLPDVDDQGARTIVEAALAEDPAGGWLQPAEVSALLDAYGIDVVPTRAASGTANAVAAAHEVGWPVALKAVGPDIVHKSDVGGVALGLASPSQLRRAARRMRTALGSRLAGFVVQPMAHPGVEMIAGVVQDRLFGPLVMLGLGGTTAELLGDRAFRILPVTDVDAAELVRSLRGSPLLFGYRGSPPVAVEHLEELLVRLGRLAADVPELAELDLNPVVVSTEGALAVDARVRLAPPPVRPLTGTRRIG